MAFIGPDLGQNRSHGNGRSRFDPEIFQHPVFIDLDDDDPLAGFHLGHKIAPVNFGSFLHQPFDQGALGHVRPEAGHGERSHQPTILVAVSTIAFTWGRAACSRCPA